jgi:hypothetical protein
MYRQTLTLCSSLLKKSKFQFANEVQTNVKSTDNAKNLTYYKNGQLTTRTAITLKKK